MERRAKMTVENRAKQFAPFAAITGLDRALDARLQELEQTERRELSPECAAELNEKLLALRRGARVTLRYYRDKKYVAVTGDVDRIEETEGLLKLGGLCVPLADIVELSFS